MDKIKLIFGILNWHWKFEYKQSDILYISLKGAINSLKKFVDIFKLIDKDDIINDGEFSELIQKLIIFLEKLDAYDNQRLTFNDFVSFFVNEKYECNNNKYNIIILEKVYNDDNLSQKDISDINSNNENEINNGVKIIVKANENNNEFNSEVNNEFTLNKNSKNNTVENSKNFNKEKEQNQNSENL